MTSKFLIITYGFIFLLILILYPTKTFAEIKLPIVSDVTISSENLRSYQDNFLYLSPNEYTLFKIDPFEFNTPQSLFLYVTDADTTIQFEIRYLMQDFDTQNPNLLLSEKIDAYYISSLKPGWTGIPLSSINKIKQRIYGIKLSVTNSALLSAYAVAEESLELCKHKYTPFISEISQGGHISEKDQEETSEIISNNTNTEKEYKYNIYSPITITQKNLPSQKDLAGTKIFNHSQVLLDTPKAAPRPKQNTCELHDYSKVKNKKTYYKCHFYPPSIYSINHEKVQSKYKIDVYSTSNPKTSFTIYNHKCKKRTLKDLRTFFRCVDIIEKKYHKTLNIKIDPYLYIKNKRFSSTVKNKEDKQENTLWASQNFTSEKAYVSSRRFGKITYHSKKQAIQINQVTSKSKPVKVPKPKSKINKPFTFIFETHVGVTQWFGKTAYSNFHTGIDFPVKNKKIISPAKGSTENYGWDSYYKNCTSGGNILKLRHYSNLYTVYMHLKSSNVRKNQTISSGTKIAVSGNTGKYNCKALGYHLHFEVRKGKNQKDSVNPVPYMNVDWGKIHTVGTKKYPGRLTGNNPHPSY